MIVAVEVTYLILVNVESEAVGLQMVDASLPNIFHPQTGKPQSATYETWVVMPKDSDVPNSHRQ